MPTKRVVDTYEDARQMRETFHASPVRRTEAFGFSWPSQVTEIGIARAEIYHSDKWKTVDDYKHVAEAPQYVFLCPGTVIEDEDGQRVKFEGERVDVEGPMPKHFAILAKCLGFMMTLHNGEHLEIRIPRAHWGGARHPETGEAFLFLYSDAGVHFIVTGDELDVTEDGIVG